MFVPNRMITMGVTLVIAASAGYVMQNGDAIASRLSANTPPMISVLDRSTRLPKPPLEAIFSASPSILQPPNAIRVAAATNQINTDILNDIETPFFLPQTCDVNMTALPRDGAMVRLNLSAPCYQNQRITVSHAGLEFTDITLADGTYSIDIPALNEFAAFAVTFADGRSVDAKTLGLSLTGFERVAVNWSGIAGLNIHAFENGATFGGAGHIWANAPDNSGDGQLIQIGNPDVFAPAFAQVYSVQTNKPSGDVTVEYLVDVALTKETCGSNIVGNSVQLTADGTFSSGEFVLTLPACDGESGYLVLNNLFNDQKIAQN